MFSIFKNPVRGCKSRHDRRYRLSIRPFDADPEMNRNPLITMKKADLIKAIIRKHGLAEERKMTINANKIKTGN